jgi:hypothetical protein
MKPICAATFVAAILLAPAMSQKSGNPFAGRWDITVTAGAAVYPDWMEVLEKDSMLSVRIQPRGGSVRPAKEARMEGSHLIVTPNPGSTWDLTVEGDSLAGVQKRGEQVTAQLAGKRAPALDRKLPKSWTKPEALFNGKNLDGWEPDNKGTSHWVAKDGVLLNESKGANLRSVRKFDDFKLHIEFNCPDDGNSGIYLRGRYEVQVEYVPEGREDRYHMMGSVYGMVAPKADLPRRPGTWESFDIILVGRRVTISRNGVKTVDNQEIAGITGGALDANEGEPGPFYFQGDHTGGMMFRNITISVPKR